jgi:hypothetical protein
MIATLPDTAAALVHVAPQPSVGAAEPSLAKTPTALILKFAGGAQPPAVVKNADVSTSPVKDTGDVTIRRCPKAAEPAKVVAAKSKDLIVKFLNFILKNIF